MGVNFIFQFISNQPTCRAQMHSSLLENDHDYFSYFIAEIIRERNSEVTSMILTGTHQYTGTERQKE